MLDFTIQNVLIAAGDDYATVDVQIVDGALALAKPLVEKLAGGIAAISPNLQVIGTAIDGKNKLLLPGFFNAHTHSSEMWQRGIMSVFPLELWLSELYDFAPLDPEQVYLSALGTAVETLLSGGTSVVDHLVLIPGLELETIAIATRAYREVGIRAFIAPLIQDESLTAGMPSGELTQTHEPYFRSTAATLVIIERR